MATRTALKIKEAFQQYSKKMCTRVTIFWMIYRVVNFIIMIVRPEISNAIVSLVQGVDTIMIVNMGVYTGNSSIEKIAIAYQKTHSAYEETNFDSDNDSDEKEESENTDNG